MQQTSSYFISYQPSVFSQTRKTRTDKNFPHTSHHTVITGITGPSLSVLARV
jgi:hypothetical protein